MNQLTVLTVGLLATVQDRGRTGWLRHGITEGGAMDPFAWRLGQRLLGNPLDCAAIEIAMGGCEIKVAESTQVAVTGAEVTVSVDGTPAPQGRIINLAAGQRLGLGRAKRGVYSYISLAGGLGTPPVLGSRSTVVREALGGHQGRGLQAGDVLPLLPAPVPRGPRLPRAPHTSFPDSERTLILRFLPGFQYDAMPAEVHSALNRQLYSVTGQKDRMGARVSGPALVTGIDALYSEATCYGAIQVPPDGQPIILLNDRQTVGGYPKLGAIIAADCRRLAQARPGTPVRFDVLSPQEADRIAWLESNFEAELSRAQTEDAQ